LLVSFAVATFIFIIFTTRGIIELDLNLVAENRYCIWNCMR